MKKKAILLCTVFTLLFGSSIVVNAQEVAVGGTQRTEAVASHDHSYRVYRKDEVKVETIKCVTPGCTVTRRHYNVVYICGSCSDMFSRAESSDSHSMHH